ncbi:MAG: N-acetylmuramoyl-L-alanine amidase [Oscillospiraceae bacterium]|nr:N-acetylmuramoyl-L-alanine amidase [Oscillospiraceae bacterium]
MKRRGTVLRTAAILLLCALFARVSGGYAREVAAEKPYYDETVIVLDAGHGDFDPGAVAADGTEEKGINLAVTLQLYDLFRANGFAVVLTRSGDRTMADADAAGTAARKRTDTHNRAALAESFSDAVLISIHQNSYADTAQHGTQMFYGTLDARSPRLAGALMDSVTARLQPENVRPLKKGTDSIYILTHTHAPTVLVECGFMTNREELALLKDEGYRRKLACAIFLGYLDYLRAPEETEDGT